jgi:hypothetical protein
MMTNETNSTISREKIIKGASGGAMRVFMRNTYAYE